MRMVRRVNGFSELSLFSLFSFQGIKALTKWRRCAKIFAPKVHTEEEAG